MNYIWWSFVKGWTATPDIRSTNARMNYVWLDMPELPHAALVQFDGNVFAF